MSKLNFAKLKTAFTLFKLEIGKQEMDLNTDCIWASTRENLSSEVCKQQRHRSVPLLFVFRKEAYLDLL